MTNFKAELCALSRLVTLCSCAQFSKVLVVFDVVWCTLVH